MIVAIDPGTTCIGVAVFHNDNLTACYLPRGRDWIETFRNVPKLGPEVLVVEDPRIYPVSKARHNDILKLARSVGAVVAKIDAPKTRLVTPATWKKSVPKHIHQRRILRALSERETAVLNDCKCPRSLRHNVVDAVGIGLWFLERM